MKGGVGIGIDAVFGSADLGDIALAQEGRRRPRIRFYCGYPLLLDDGSCIGTLCLVDTRPRDFGGRGLALLSDMTSQMKDMPAIGRWAAVSDAVRLAYPDRGIEVLKDAASWLDFPSLNRQAQVCSLCQRSLAGLRQDGLIICPVCARIRNERDLPTEATFAEIIRALEAYAGEEKEALVAEGERQWRTNRLRVVDSAQCAACRDSGSAVSGRATLCFVCLAAGRIPTVSAQAP